MDSEIVERKANPKVNPYQKVKLNIGGQKFVTTRETLASKGENYFTSLLSGQFETVKDKKGYYFIDRDGKYFEPILEYLRTGDFSIPPRLSEANVFREAAFYCTQLPRNQFECFQNVLDYTKGVFMRKDHFVGLGPDMTGFEISHRTSLFEFTYQYQRPYQLHIKRKHRQTEILWFLHGPFLFESSTKPLKFHAATSIFNGAIYEPPEPRVLLTFSILGHSIRVYGFRCAASNENEDVMYCLFETAKSTEAQWEVCSVTPKKFYHMDSYFMTYSGTTLIPMKKTSLDLEVLIFRKIVLVRLVTWELRDVLTDGVMGTWDRQNHFFYRYNIVKFSQKNKKLQKFELV